MLGCPVRGSLPATPTERLCKNQSRRTLTLVKNRIDKLVFNRLLHQVVQLLLERTMSRFLFCVLAAIAVQGALACYPGNPSADACPSKCKSCYGGV